MACLSLVAQADDFQHAGEEFFYKALVVLDMRTGLYQLRRFESTDLLAHDRENLMTYRVQSSQHGWHLNSAGLPQCAVETALLTFLQDALLNPFEEGHPVPTSVVLWMKGHEMVARFSALALSLAETPTTVPQALAFARWFLHIVILLAELTFTVVSQIRYFLHHVCVVVVVECDGFQHGLAPFSLRCMAIACGQTRSTYTQLFDTSELLQDGLAAFRTYHFQTQHHGLVLSGQELPQSMAISVLIHAINEILLELTEERNPAPQLTLLWVKEGHLRDGALEQL
ncbi:hypothetical protein ACROYT_G031713 [Oculina patagonica]